MPYCCDCWWHGNLVKPSTLTGGLAHCFIKGQITQMTASILSFYQKASCLLVSTKAVALCLVASLMTGLYLFWLVILPVQAQSVDDIWQDEEFEEEVINQIVFDDGVLWIGTNLGLWRYDGRSAQCWESENECRDTAEANPVLSLLLDDKDRLWIGTMEGLFVLDADREWSERAEPLPEMHDPVWVLASAPTGGVWIGSDSGLYYVSGLGSMTDSLEDIKPISLSTEAIDALAPAENGDLWIGTRDSGLFVLQQATDEQPQLLETTAEPDPRINALYLDEEGVLWVGTEHGLCAVATEGPLATCRPLPFVELEEQTITGLFPDSATPGGVWVATSGQLWHFTPPATLAPADSELIDVRTIVTDGEGQQWAGSTGGLFRRQPRQWRPLLPNTLPQDVRAMVEDSQGTLWVGTARGLFWQATDGRWLEVEDLQSVPIRCLFASEQDNALWVCLDVGIARVDLNVDGSPPSIYEEDYGELAQQIVNDIWQDAEGTLWLATRAGVWQKMGAKAVQHRADEGPSAGPAHARVAALASDGEGGFWAGTLNGLSHFDGASWRSHPCSDETVEINDLVWDDARQQLWIATREGLGLCAGEAYVRQVTEGELIDSNIRSLTLGKTQEEEKAPPYLLAGTYEGLSRINIRTPRPQKLPVTSYNEDSHLPNNRVQALYVRDSGQLLLGTPEGLYAYQPSQKPPKLYFCYPECSNFDSLRAPAKPLTLAYNDDNSLQVFGHDLRTQPENLIYRLEIDNSEGISQTWSANGDLALSTSLLPPDETMTVTAWAYDRDFNQSAEPAVLEIIRQAEPLEQQTRFQVLIVLITAALIALVWWLTNWLRFVQFQNLEVTLSPNQDPDFHNVQIRGGRWFSSVPKQLKWGRNRWIFNLPAEERPRNIDTIQTELDRISNLAQLSTNDKLDLLQKVGSKLYDSLFSAETTAVLRAKLGLGDIPVRLRLVIDQGLADARALPWELLYGGDELRFLTINEKATITLVRDYPKSHAKVRNVNSRLNILLLISSPRDMPVPAEIIENEIGILKHFADNADYPVNLKTIRHTTKVDLADIAPGEFDFIHFLGHGSQEDGQAVLYFEDEYERDKVRVKQGQLVKQFARAQPKFIFLNACRSAKSVNLKITLSDSQRGSSSLAEALVTQARIPAVIGMGYEIDSKAANAFSSAFYQKLVQLGQVDDAVADGRMQLSSRKTVGIASRAWFTPRLYLGVKGNAIYKQNLIRQHHLVQTIRKRLANNHENSDSDKA